MGQATGADIEVGAQSSAGFEVMLTTIDDIHRL